MYLMGYKVIYGENFFYKWLPALTNRLSGKEIVYKGGKVYRVVRGG